MYSDRKCISCQKTTVPIISDLSKCGGCRGTGLRCARQCRSVILRRENFALRTASSSRRTRRLRPDGLSPLGIRDTGQNASQVQDAFRSLHYVAETCLPPSACPAITTISLLFWGQTPCCVGPGPKKCARNTSLFRYFLRYRQNSIK